MVNYEQLLRALDDAVSEAMAKGPVAILFSGGLDSGLLAALARRHGRPHLYTVGVASSHDLRMSEEAAALLDLPWTAITLTDDEIISASRETLAAIRIESPVVLSFELPLQIIASRAEEPILVSGQGADEMFGGYNRYLSMDVATLEAAMKTDLENVLSEGVGRDNALAGRYGKSACFPFLEPTVRRAAASIPIEEMIVEGSRKAPLRSVLRSLDLEVLASREKKAAQYGSGFMKVLKATARRSGLELKDYIATLQPEQHK